MTITVLKGGMGWKGAELMYAKEVKLGSLKQDCYKLRTLTVSL